MGLLNMNILYYMLITVSQKNFCLMKNYKTKWDGYAHSYSPHAHHDYYFLLGSLLFHL